LKDKQETQPDKPEVPVKKEKEAPVKKDVEPHQETPVKEDDPV
jgi:hypothetical protein